MPIRIEIIGDSPEQLSGLLQGVAAAFKSAGVQTTDVVAHTLDTQVSGEPVSVAGGTVKRGPGRPRKNPEPAEAAQEPAQEEAKDTPADEEAAPPALDEKEAEKARDEAVKLLTQVYARTTAGGPAHIKRLQTEFGVSKFSNTPLDKAAALLAAAQAADAETQPKAA